MPDATPSPSPAATRARLPLVVVWAVLGMLFGGTVAVAVQRDGQDRPPPGWVLERPELPVQLASLKQAEADDGWPLDSHNTLVSDAVGTTALELSATLPAGARLTLELTDGRQRVGLEVSRDGERRTRQVLTRDGRNQRMPCAGGPLPPPGDAVDAAVVLDSGGVTLRLGEATVRCQVAGMGAARAQVEAGLRQVRIQRIQTTGPGGPVDQRAGRSGGLAMVGGAVVGAGLGALAGALLPRAAILGGIWLGLAPVLATANLERLLEAMRVVAERPALWAVGLPLVLALGGLLVVGVGGGLRREWSVPLPALAVCGLCLGLFGIPAYGPVVGIVAGLVAAGLGVLLPRLGVRLWPGERESLGRLVVAAALLGGAAGLGVLALRPQYGMVGVFAAEVGGLAAVVLWANVRSVRGFNLLSLGGAVGMLLLTNQGLRWTAWGDRLVGRSARADPAGTAGAADTADSDAASTWSSFEALETTREWTDYPDQDYPVAPAARRPGALRIVAMGGSSTGGAWQNDDLDEFWPAELERRLGAGVQVINQGVGGWTSFHVRHFLETRIDDVDPDIVVLYIGHNDAMTPSPVPYAQLFAAWKQKDDWRVGLSSRLGGVPLYQVVRYGLLAGVLDEDGVAVPPEDFDENVERMAAVLRPRGARLVLASEGITPLAERLEPWTAVMQQQAAADDVLYVDTAALLGGATGAPVFLDACHLTGRGHGLVAEAVGRALREKGWLPGP